MAMAGAVVGMATSIASSAAQASAMDAQADAMRTTADANYGVEKRNVQEQYRADRSELASESHKMGAKARERNRELANARAQAAGQGTSMFYGDTVRLPSRIEARHAYEASFETANWYEGDRRAKEGQSLGLYSAYINRFNAYEQANAKNAEAQATRTAGVMSGIGGLVSKGFSVGGGGGGGSSAGNSGLMYFG